MTTATAVPEYPIQGIALLPKEGLTHAPRTLLAIMEPAAVKTAGVAMDQPTVAQVASPSAMPMPSVVSTLRSLDKPALSMYVALSLASVVPPPTFATTNANQTVALPIGHGAAVVTFGITSSVTMRVGSLLGMDVDT